MTGGDDLSAPVGVAYHHRESVESVNQSCECRHLGHRQRLVEFHREGYHQGRYLLCRPESGSLLRGLYCGILSILVLPLS